MTCKHFTGTVNLVRWERGKDGFRRYVKVPTRVSMIIDIEALMEELGNKALDNRSHKTRAVHGLIVAGATRLDATDSEETP